MTRPIPKNEEIPLNPKEIIVSKTDPQGVITYANDVFIRVCGYSEQELIGSPHNIVRHPDMPRIAFKLMWDTIKQGKNFRAVVKNLAKDGRFYWVVTDFEPLYDAKSGKIIQHTAYRMPAPRKAIAQMAPIYKKLCEIEKVSGMEGSLAYLNGFFAANNTNYSDFIDRLVKDSSGPMLKIFSFLKKMFKK